MVENVLKSADKVSSPRMGGLTFIEQLHARSISVCPKDNVPYMIGYSKDNIVMTRASCKTWACPVCSARNGKRWIARIINHVNNVDTGCWRFLTITAHEKWRGAERSIQNLRQGWKKLYNRLRRKFGKVDYAKVYEPHEDGSFHLHVLYAGSVTKKWLKSASRSCGMGYMCDSSDVKNAGQVAGYIAKYLLKSFEHAERYKSGMRRIECSRSWTKLEKLDSGYNWAVVSNRTMQERKVKYNRLWREIVDLRPSRVDVWSSQAKFYTWQLIDKCLV